MYIFIKKNTLETSFSF